MAFLSTFGLDLWLDPMGNLITFPSPHKKKHPGRGNVNSTLRGEDSQPFAVQPTQRPFSSHLLGAIRTYVGWVPEKKNFPKKKDGKKFLFPTEVSEG